MYKTVIIYTPLFIMIHMFQQYQYAIMTPNFNCFAYILMHSTHSSSMSPISPFLSCFKFYLFSIYFQCHFCCFNNYLHLQQFQCFQFTFLSSSFSMFFHAFAITHIENKKVLEYNQMVNAKLLIMLDCKQLNIWLSLTRGMQLARKHIIAYR